jgi:hypothetical protein
MVAPLSINQGLQAGVHHAKFTSPIQAFQAPFPPFAAKKCENAGFVKRINRLPNHELPDQRPA